MAVYKKFNHNPKDFIIKFEETWYSEDRVILKYSANGGKSWKYVHHAKPPFLGNIDYDWEWETLKFTLGDNDLRREKEKFSSYQKILDYESEQAEIYIKGQETIERQRRIREEKRLEALKKANS